MVNGNYVLYGDRPSSESEIVDDHVQTRTAERKEKRKQRPSNERGNTQLDNETDSVKYEKKIKEPKLLRYIPTTDVEENFVTEKFETYDMKPSEERPRRYAFTKKAKNPTDGSVNYAYSRSNSNSPNSNLPTISEHCEQYGTYRVRKIQVSTPDDLPPYESKLDKYFIKPRDGGKFNSKISYNGSHPDSLYRVPNNAGVDGSKVVRVMRALRWPAALLVVCAALAIFVYFLMPDNMDSRTDLVNSTYWESAGAKTPHSELTTTSPKRSTTIASKPIKPGETKKPVEIDFYDADNEKNNDLATIIDAISEKNPKRKLPIPPVFPSHLSPEVQYGNEKADKNKPRIAKVFDDKNNLPVDPTLKPHITQKPEKPLAIYFKDAVPGNLYPETINRAETVNDFNPYEKQKLVEPLRYPSYRVKEIEREPYIPEVHDIYPRNRPFNISFTSGHSKIFGLGIEDIEKMQSTTQSSVYNTRVSPTLPTWRDGDDSTTKKYPVNLNIDAPQCQSPLLSLCRGVLPYDLAGPPPKISGKVITAYLQDLEFVVSTNCSERIRQFVCSLLEPECNPPPFPPKRPCHMLCKAVYDSCESFIPTHLMPAFNCRQYDNNNCMKARAPCYSREFTCKDASCVPRDWICDGTNDCPDGEDEKGCSACEKNQYQCPSGGCVQNRWVCDGYLDCPEGEDESDAACASSQTSSTTKGPSAEVAEPGEEGAGSAPAPSIRRPNTLPGREGREHSNSRTAIEDSSKELLVTSDSSNALKRNFTRRPSPTRLKPYRAKSRPTTGPPRDLEEEVVHVEGRPVKPPPNPIPTSQEMKSSWETYEPFGVLKDLLTAKNKKEFNNENIPIFDAKMPVVSNQDQKKPSRLSNNGSNQFDRVINGAAILRKAAAEEAAERAKLLSKPPPEFEVEEEEKRHHEAPGRSSPCPSGELRCVDGLCITLAQLCDGTIDCTDHADEDNCYT